MEFISAKCPSCGGELMLPKDLEQANCLYCGSKFFVKQAINYNDIEKAENWEDLADTALKGGNFSEAHDYFTKLLEINSKNSMAWIGKGASLGFLSDFNTPRLKDMISYFSKALDCVEKEKYDSTKKIIVSKIIEITRKLHIQTRNFLYADDSSLDQSTWGNIGKLRDQILESVDFGLDLDNENVKLATNGLDHIYLFRNKYLGIIQYVQGSRTKSFSITDQEEYKLTIKYNSYKEIVKKIEPDKKISDFRKEGCYIATATMGNYDHPNVIILRKFRDENLEKTVIGRLFIKSYYAISPFFARMIERSEVFRKISLILLIQPTVRIIRKLL